MVGDDSPPPPPPPKIEPNSPYYLGPQDRPGDFITPTRLKGDNYEEWVVDIQTALEAIRKFDFLDGTIIEPQPSCSKSDWTAINSMLISWLTNTINVEVKSSLSKFRELKPFWDHLKKRFAQTNGPRVQQIRTSLAKCEQTKAIAVSVYYGKLHALWKELDHYEPLMSCKCCTNCTAGREHEVRREQSKLHDFLMGLYAGYYSSLHTNILSQDSLPSLDRAYQYVTQEERIRIANQGPEEKQPNEALGFAVRASTSNSRASKSCSYCKRSGHNVSGCLFKSPCPYCQKKGHDPTKCYELTGYLEGWTPRPRGGVRDNAASADPQSTSLGQAFSAE